ncbi:tyrosine-type recombinase/integrase [Actinomadura sp. GTD37]|uniref:tyrosine-type recombinase/integrase n=1 Tax=Actinomadura sp. GTD37 TaxID=1778030 RepID=UPI0035BEDB27
MHSVLRKAFGNAVRVDELIASNPTERAKRPRLHRDEPGKVWTPEQLRAFLLTADGHRLSAFFRLAAYTGARRGELLNLRCRDVDLDGASIQIKGSVGFVAGERIEGTTKSGRSRVVSIDPGTVGVLKAHRKRKLADNLEAGEFWKGTDDGHVFATGWVSRCIRIRSLRLWRR